MVLNLEDMRQKIMLLIIVKVLCRLCNTVPQGEIAIFLGFKEKGETVDFFIAW
jgi:hypothetical protein